MLREGTVREEARSRCKLITFDRRCWQPEAHAAASMPLSVVIVATRCGGRWGGGRWRCWRYRGRFCGG